ncbi:MAG: hypothetical protein JETT_3661 [Candidatus Jettenia ecosi]|uniref:Uncharacterized protein n=1 Tax=Candidatus Jettenia ecosi TaxID=2494326 RepID=A0A533Q674_9BACT|nr:MAG: hypothetical protein JETT_3661 [Candidatus Jettenia ecosi]
MRKFLLINVLLDNFHLRKNRRDDIYKASDCLKLAYNETLALREAAFLVE